MPEEFDALYMGLYKKKYDTNDFSTISQIISKNDESVDWREKGAVAAIKN